MMSEGSRKSHGTNQRLPIIANWSLESMCHGQPGLGGTGFRVPAPPMLRANYCRGLPTAAALEDLVHFVLGRVESLFRGQLSEDRALDVLNEGLVDLFVHVDGTDVFSVWQLFGRDTGGFG